MLARREGIILNIAILGYGIVGGGTHALLKDGSLGIHVRRVLDVRPIDGLHDLLTDNIGDILGDPSIDCVVETIGGMHPALSFVTSSLRAGKHVVTSNKELISHALAPLSEGAGMHGVQIRFSASVGGGIPWIDTLQRRKRSDRIEAVSGIVNGTTNFILDAMQGGAAFEEALSAAREKGYAEIDASADLDGIDTQRKCAISAALAFETILEPEQIPTLGIGSIQKADVEAFLAEGLVCKLMMHAARHQDGIACYVEPTLLSRQAPAAHTPTNHNHISLIGRETGTLSLFGEGAGRYPTAQNIVQDLLDIDAGIKYPPRAVQPLPLHTDGIAHPYYVRAASKEAQAVQAGQMGPGVRTSPLTLEAAHRLFAAIRAEDPNAFFAGFAPDAGMEIKG